MKTTDKFQRYMDTYAGRDLVKRYGKDLKVDGVWEILGEDPNCNFGGEPRLGTVVGNLKDAVQAAVLMDRFWTWGAGGNIVKVTIATVDDLHDASKLRAEIATREKELQELKDKLNAIGG